MELEEPSGLIKNGNKMFYVVQKNVFREENYDKIFQALDRLGLEYEIIDCPPFVEKLEFNTERKDVFTFGSVKMARLASEAGWHPGSFYGGNHDFSIYSKKYGEHLLNADSIICKFAHKLEWGINEAKFIRPCKDSKVFTGGTFSKVKWEDLVERSLTNGHTTSLDKDTLIQVATVKRIYKEARIWIVDGKVVTSSYYRYGENVEYTENVEPDGIEFAERMIATYQVAPAFVMDICLTPDGWKIVEINCINCSGFYRGDLQRVIIALENLYNPLN